MKRILFIASQPFFQWRGSPIRLGFDLQALSETGYTVDFLTLPIGLKKEIPGVRIIRAPNLLKVRHVPIGPSASKACFDLILLLMALALARRNQYDVVHCVEDTGIIGVILKAVFKCKLVFEKHSDPSSYKKGVLRNLIMSTYAAVERFVIRHADASIATGPGLVEQIKSVGTDRPAHHIFDIPSSLADSTPERIQALRSQFKRSENDVLITYVGSFAVYQGVELMFTAIPEVVSKTFNALFVIIGGTDEEIENERRKLRERNTDQAVLFIGKVPPDELPDYLAASDILLSPRLAGVNTPLKLLDYLKAGRAIVATDTSANRLILDETTAVLTATDPAAFAEGILALVNDSAQRRQLGANGHKLIEEKYNFENFKERLAACYTGLQRGLSGTNGMI